jgi:hypothetical protein
MIFIFHAVNISLNNNPFSVIHQPVDQGRGQGVVHVEEFAPVPEGSVRGDHDRSGFITGGDNPEQQIGSTLVDGQKVQLIEEEMTGTHETFSARVLIYRSTLNKTKNETDFSRAR